MKDKKRTLYLYEALELRAEYDARIKTLKDCLPETKQNRDRFSFGRDDDGYVAPVLILMWLQLEQTSESSNSSGGN